MFKIKFKTWLLVLVIKTLKTVGLMGQYLVIFFSWLFNLIARSFYWLIYPAVSIYRFIFSIRRYLTTVLAPLRGTLFVVFARRQAIHTAILFIAFLVSINSLNTRVARAEDLGTRSILYALVSETGDEIINEDATETALQYPTEYLVDVVAVRGAPAIDFDYFDEEYVGLIPGETAIFAPYAYTTNGAVPTRTTTETYVVEEGDTISTIADHYGLSIDSLLWANKLTVRSYIRPGDRLTVPPVNGVLHEVKRGDTIEKIAKSYQATVQEILSWNRIGEDQILNIGETLIVPGGRMPAPPAPVRRVSSPSTLFRGTRPPDATVPVSEKMLWPTAARRITQYFGWRHTGVDIAGQTGTAIYAAEDGIVEFAGWNKGGYGQYIMLNHGNGKKTRYAHASKLYVSKGDQVKKGETIAAVGSTGRSTGPHLHFEVIQNGKYKNPFEYISKP